MKSRFVPIILLALLPVSAMAEHELKQESDSVMKVVELRQSACFSYDLPKNFSISLEEELRESLMDRTYSKDGVLSSDAGAAFSKSYTTIDLGWKFFSQQSLNTGYKYSLRLNAGYTLRYLATKMYDDGVRQSTGKYLRHRPYVSLTGAVDFGSFKLSVRERYLVDCRTDSIDVREKPQYAMELRHRVRLDYSIPGKPLKPFVYAELTNTLNEPTCPWLGTDGNPIYGGQYLNSVRAVAGLKWKIDKHNSLTIYYQFQYEQERDVHITTKENVKLFHNTAYNHIIGVAYDLGY